MKTIEGVAAGPIDWSRFLTVVERHRVAPLAFDGLSDVAAAIPKDVYATLRARAMRDRVGALQLTGLLATVTTILAEAGIEAVSIKGPTLGVLAFGNASSRQSRDIDVLIPQSSIVPALAALSAVECHLFSPSGFESPRQFQLWAQSMKDLTLLHKPSGAVVELHWRLDDNPHLLPPITTSRQTIRIGGFDATTLGHDDLLLYLCVHGAKHFWSRLKWLADVYALLRADADAVAAFYGRAFHDGLHVPAGQMLLLLETVYGLELPPAVRSCATRHWRTRWFASAALRYLKMENEPQAARFGLYGRALKRFLLRSERRYVLHECHRILLDLPTFVRYGGTRRAYMAATAGRPIFWLIRKISQRMRPGAGN